MNRQAVALAADSAVTTSGRGGGAVVTLEAEKLFEVGVGIGLMVHNRGDLVGRSWSQIVGEFVRQQGLKSYPSVGHCAEAFFGFLEDNRKLFPANEEAVEFGGMLATVFATVREHAEYVLSYANPGLGSMLEAVDNAVAVLTRHLETGPGDTPRARVSAFAGLELDAFKSQCQTALASAMDSVFADLNLPRALRDRLVQLAWLTLTRSFFLEPYTGMVFAGFGSEATFPVAETHSSSFMLNGRIKRYRTDVSAVAGLDGPTGIIQTYAQADMTHTFVRGIHPHMFDEAVDLAQIAMKEAARRALAEAGVDAASSKRAMRAMEDNHIPAITEQYASYLNALSYDQFSDPVLTVIAAAGKRQIAEMARTLVALNIIRDELHQRQRGVGGSVDVAMITPNGGLEWFSNKNGE